MLLRSALIIGLMYGCIKAVSGGLGKIMALITGAAGVITAGFMAYMKNATAKVDTTLWNLRTTMVSMALVLVFLLISVVGAVFEAGFGRTKSEKLKKCRKIILQVQRIGSAISLSLLIALELFYILPDVLAYPYAIYNVEKNVFSTGFLLKNVGVVLGVLLLFITSLAVSAAAQRIYKYPSICAAAAALIINLVRQYYRCLNVAYSVIVLRRTVTDRKAYDFWLGFLFDPDMFKDKERKHEIFESIKNFSNNENIFGELIMILALIIPVVLIIITFVVKKPYDNPAQKRKIRFNWKVCRRWAVSAIMLLVFLRIDVTAISEYANREIALSPVEASRHDDTYVYVDFDQVTDGHLHRFAYVSEEGTEIRFIVIKKPNSSAFGIGLDACDICGEAGYYERDDQVVCKRCDVVMNINTIGFKGGCNPIILNDIKIENQTIKVPISELLLHEKEFK